MKKGNQITPWSFYANQYTAQPVITDINPQQLESKQQHVQKKQKIKKKKKRDERQPFFSQNSEQKMIIPQNYRQISKSTLQMYCPIIKTSIQMINMKDQIIDLNNKLILFSAIKQILRQQQSLKLATSQSKQLKKKYQCLFPMLKPRQHISIKRIKACYSQFPIDLFKYKYRMI